MKKFEELDAWVTKTGKFVVGPINQSGHFAVFVDGFEHYGHLLIAAANMIETLKTIDKLPVKAELDGADGAKWTWRDIAIKQATLAHAAIVKAEGGD